MTSSPRPVVFDLDGTLLDSLDDIRSALVGTLRAIDGGAPDRETVRTWVGGGARELITFAVRAARGRADGHGADDAAEIDALLADFRGRYHAAPVVHSRLYDGIAPVLDALAEAGRPLAVLSNKPHDLTVLIADVVLTRWPFAVIAGHRPDGPLKPDRAAAAPLLAGLGAPAGACTMVGDSDVDLAFARAAGMRAVAVSWGFRPRAELLAAAPDAIVDEPAGLLAVL